MASCEYNTNNRYFDWANPNAIDGCGDEDGLIRDLIDEQIFFYGTEFQYLPRTQKNFDNILTESSKSTFKRALPVVLYIQSHDGYDGNGDSQLLSKFGLRSSEQMTVVMSRRRFEEDMAPVILQDYIDEGGVPDRMEGETDLRPKEGDLIWFKMDNSLFEITQVVFDVPFFIRGSAYTFVLYCEKFEYSGETFVTGNPDIDIAGEESGYYFTTLTMDAGGELAFTQHETVNIYNLTGIETPQLEVPDPIVPFQINSDSGVKKDVDTLNATVVSWDADTRTLVLKDLTNMNSDQRDVDNNITANDLDNVLVIGNTSVAKWISNDGEQLDAPFVQNVDIQTEMDTIKIVDSGDDNPFGFV